MHFELCYISILLIRDFQKTASYFWTQRNPPRLCEATPILLLNKKPQRFNYRFVWHDKFQKQLVAEAQTLSSFPNRKLDNWVFHKICVKADSIHV